MVLPSIVTLLASIFGCASCVRLQSKSYLMPAGKGMQLRDVEPTAVENDAKAKFLAIDTKTETFLKLKDRLVADAGEFPLHKTLVALDFDFTLRDNDPDDPNSGVFLTLEETTREFLEWAKANKVPVIIVTARHPDSRTWQRTWGQVSQDLKIDAFIGNHVPTRISNASIKEPCTETLPNSLCNVFEYTYSGHPYKLHYVEAFGLVVAGHEKGEAITNFINLHGMDVSQVVFADDLASHATNVARICTREEQIERVLGVWLVRNDHPSATKEFVDGVFDASNKLEACLKTETSSACNPKFYKDSWCNPRMPAYLGDNSFNPLQPSNLFDVEAIRLGYFPSGADELTGPRAALELAKKQERDIWAIKTLCKDKEEEEQRAISKAEDVAKQKLLASGVLPDCTGAFQCVMNKNKPPAKRQCDIDKSPCV